MTTVMNTCSPPPHRTPRTFTHESPRMVPTMMSFCVQKPSGISMPGLERTSLSEVANTVASAAMEAVRMIQNSTQPHRNPASRP